MKFLLSDLLSVGKSNKNSQKTKSFGRKIDATFLLPPRESRPKNPCPILLRFFRKVDAFIAKEYKIEWNEKFDMPNCMIAKVARPGIEPGTSWLWIMRANQLSYLAFLWKNGAKIVKKRLSAIERCFFSGIDFFPSLSFIAKAKEQKGLNSEQGIH